MKEMKKTNIGALKRNPYGNCKVFDIDGELLFRCGIKKINWYLKRGLATMLNDNDNLSIILKFRNNGNRNKNDTFLISNKKNQCIVCGSLENLSKHHIIPRCYRSFFPKELKSHNSHDVLPICLNCHSEYEISAFELKKEIGIKYNSPINNKVSGEIVEIAKAIGYIRNLKEHDCIIPANRRKAMKKYIKKVFGRLNVTQEEISEIENSIIKPRAHGEVVVEKVKDLYEFIFMWRNHFIENTKPRYLPEGWSVDYVLNTDVEA